MTEKIFVALVIPAFNEAATIGEVVRGAKAHVPLVVVVDDHSIDRTGEMARIAGAELVSHRVNRGYDSSIDDGFQKALELGATHVITFDADGQHQAKDLPHFLEAFSRGVEALAGERAHLTHPAEIIFSWYSRARFGIGDPLCGMKGYSARIYRACGPFDSLQSIGTQLLFRAIRSGAHFERVPIEVLDRKDTSRFYHLRLRGNLKILRALWRVMTQL